jgi:hypothetical protein
MISTKIKDMGRMHQTGKDYESENRILRKDGKYLWHLTRAGFKKMMRKIKMDRFLKQK